MSKLSTEKSAQKAEYFLHEYSNIFADAQRFIRAIKTEMFKQEEKLITKNCEQKYYGKVLIRLTKKTTTPVHRYFLI